MNIYRTVCGARAVKLNLGVVNELRRDAGCLWEPEAPLQDRDTVVRNIKCVTTEK